MQSEQSVFLIDTCKVFFRPISKQTYEKYDSCNSNQKQKENL